MSDDERLAGAGGRTGDFTCLVVAVLILAGFAALAVRLKEIQLDSSATITLDGARQSVRRVRIPGERGRIVARDGTVLAMNRPTRRILLNPAAFQKQTWGATATNILEAVGAVAKYVGRPSPLDFDDVARHMRLKLARPIVAWSDVSDEELARFSEASDELTGFFCDEAWHRMYPAGPLAAHVLGYVGREATAGDAGDSKYNFTDFDMRGRSGLEDRYDSFLKGVSGEKKITVDARGFARKEWVVSEPLKGPDLVVTLDMAMQREAERQLEGVKGACVALDPRNGDILAMASSPGYDPNDFVPAIPRKLYDRLSHDPGKPLLNRAALGSYAPGSTFKPITALAGLSCGISPRATHLCTGAYTIGEMRIRCSRTWGHGDLDLAHALKESCNPYFCDMGVKAGTNVLMRTAKIFGLGSKTGIDYSAEAAGVVPDDEWKRAHWGERWYPGDLPQMSIGQGMLLVSPLQMARVAGALGTGRLVRPHFKAGEDTHAEALPFPKWQLDAVRAGMRMVVDGGTGRRGGENLSVKVAGKTGTAEVGRGATRRKNTWFIAYAPAENPTVAIALIVENGESGGGTAAPRVREILKARFGENEVAASSVLRVGELGWLGYMCSQMLAISQNSQLSQFSQLSQLSQLSQPRQ